MNKYLITTLAAMFSVLILSAQPLKLILNQEEGSITFAVDEVTPPAEGLKYPKNGMTLAGSIQNKLDITNSQQEIIACSFAKDEKLFDFGEDVLFQMLLQAWCQHRPVVLTPDSIWLLICQQFSYAVNENPEKYRTLLVNHQDKEELRIQSRAEILSDQADWSAIIGGFTSAIDKMGRNDIAAKLVADFSTTGADERIASEVTLMDAVKAYFEYTVYYMVCGIPSITLTGMPADWQKVLEKTQALETFGVGDWVAQLKPILEEFVKASEGNPDYWFWKDIVKKTRPKTIQGPACTNRPVKLTEFDGWFLKFFPYGTDGPTPSKVKMGHHMLRETVLVPFRYQIVTPDGALLSETPMELIAGIVGVREDPDTYALTPQIGWFVRKGPAAEKTEEAGEQTIHLVPSIRTKYWNDGPLRLSDFLTQRGEFPKVSELKYGVIWQITNSRTGNTVIRAPFSETFMSPYASWIHPQYRNKQSLLYLQTAFDYVEICRRRAMANYQKDRSTYFQFTLDNHMDVAKSFLAQMRDDTSWGQDTAGVRYYSERVKAELARTPDWVYDDIQVPPNGFGLGLHLGVGSEFYTGPLTAYATPSAGIDFGVDLAYNRINLFLNGLLGWGGKYKKDIVLPDYHWNAGESMKAGNLEISLGYAIKDAQWWKITPFVGIGAGFIDYPYHPADASKHGDEIAGFRFQAGLAADYKFFRLVENVSSLDGVSEFSVRGKLYLAHTSFPYPAPAWSVNLGIGVNVLARLHRPYETTLRSSAASF